jgi:hypothetical protein
VSAVEWAPQTNKLLSASHDRNAFVWQQNAGSCPCPVPARRSLRALRTTNAPCCHGYAHSAFAAIADAVRVADTAGTWEPVLVVLRLNRAALCASWNQTCALVCSRALAASPVSGPVRYGIR